MGESTLAERARDLAVRIAGEIDAGPVSGDRAAALLRHALEIVVALAERVEQLEGSTMQIVIKGPKP